MKKVTIGNATLYCADCMDILPTLPKVDAVWTDPPYNVGMDYGLHDDNMPDNDYLEWCSAWILQLLRICPDRISIYPPKYKIQFFLSHLPKCHIVVCTWSAAGAMHGSWMHQYAPILLSTPQKKTADHWHNIQMPGLGFFYKEERYNHPGRTSDELTLRVLDCVSKEKETILDPFMGSGTTGVAAIQLGRSFIGIEREPKYFDIACQRI
jgi:site-specific DNA-methyltransferase (adenine-specific)